MNLLIYIDSITPAGGIERVVAKHISFFAKKHNVTLLTKDSDESFYKLPQNIERVSLHINNQMNMQNRFHRILQTIKQLWQTRKKLKAYKESHDLFYVAHIRNLLELYLSGIDMSKVVVTEHGSYYGYNIAYKLFKRWLYPKCKYVISPTTMDYKIYEAHHCNVIYIPNPLSFYNENRADLNKKTVLNIGRFTNDKQQILLLDIWREVSKKHPKWELLLVGKGELEQQLLTKIHKYGLEKTVKIVKPTKNIESLFLNSSIFAFTSKYEGFGMVLAEAMSCGVPCISFDIPSGPRDIIDNSVDGFLIRNGDISDYITKLELLITDTELRTTMGQKAKNNIQKFLDTKIEKQWDNLLEHGKPKL